MSETILPPGDCRHENTLTLTTTSLAKADGIETNSATAHLARNGCAISGQPVSFLLSGHAIFSQGGKQTTAITDAYGNATVFFTDTVQETVNITCVYYQLQASGYSRFNAAAQSGLDISAEVVTDKAPANGISPNELLYSVYDTARRRVPGVQIDFSTTGSALLSSPSGITNAQGQFPLTLTNNVAQQVLVSAQVPSAPNATNYTFLEFIRIPVFLLTSNTLVNNTPAGSGVNRILFMLTADNAPAANQQLSFSVSPSTASVTPASALTNANGQVEVDVSSSVAGDITVTANATDTGLQPIHVVVVFTAVVQRYFIANEVLTDHALANGSAQNRVRFTVLSRANNMPQPNIGLTFSVTGNAQLAVSSGTTNAQGQFELGLTNTIPQQVRVTTSVTSEPITNSNVDLTFIL
ncbi:Ig-like domain-containing protein [Martelella alba]|uniref:Big-1 domain-containing protein n=1 Tax=Martelella alba TaxID=2590451 RepID=A0ABY2SKI0_9HYPH|nr:Ig-like domain-containing protein [Martelella alba]TKI06089.1 hypothetical protein FCN80_11235 [Martelella alba]